jgi:predicted nucleic acid-binding protein
MLLLVSDANILIDLEEGGIIALLFRLSYEIVTPDLLFADEMAAMYPHLPDWGLKLGELGAAAMFDVARLSQTYRGPSRYDCMALALARQESCPLLSGDRDLRQAALNEGVSVHGTIWVVEQMLSQGLLNPTSARSAFDAMRNAGSRLPWAEVEKMIKRISEKTE